MRIALVTLLGVLAAVLLPLHNQEQITIRTNVNLVQVDVRVTDQAGHAVSGLDKAAFQVRVDGVPQPITVFQGEDAPVTAGIVVDNSASMAPNRRDVIESALAFARASNPKDQMFVVHFSSRVRFGLPDGMPFTSNVSELETAIAAFDFGGTTALYDALLAAESHLGKAVYPRKVLLAITDGGDNSSVSTLAQVLNTSLEAGIVVYSIGIFDAADRDQSPQILAELSGKTGGKAFFPKNAGEIARICAGIAQDIRKQYTIGFPGAEDGEYHPIVVTVTSPARGPLEVQTRPGYLAAKAPAPVPQK